MGCLFNAARGAIEGTRPGEESWFIMQHHIQKYDTESKFQHMFALAKYFRALAWETS